jgi:Fe-S-cluster containining protein
VLQAQPGPLAPDDIEDCAFLAETIDSEVKLKNYGLVQAACKDLAKETTEGTITPRYRKGRCVFLDENDRCSIHPVVPRLRVF